jgi:pyridoxamine 5'-phosphate oxidase family protein
MDATETQPAAQAGLFTENEIAYLKSQHLCRLATVGANGQPHVMPVGFRFNVETGTFDIAGHFGFAKRKKWRDVEANPKVALVVDDIASTNPWTVRGIEIRGTVELMYSGGDTVLEGGDPEMFHITPKRIVSWGLDTDSFSAANARTVNETTTDEYSA